MAEITIRLQADGEIVKALNELAHSMKLLSASINALAETKAQPAANDGQAQPAQQVQQDLPFEPKPAAKPEPAVEEAKPANGQPKVTLEAVREKLAALSQAGKQAEVKKLINSFGAKKLTDVPPEKYPELLAAAEAIGE